MADFPLLTRAGTKYIEKLQINYMTVSMLLDRIDIFTVKNKQKTPIKVGEINWTDSSEHKTRSSGHFRGLSITS